MKVRIKFNPTAPVIITNVIGNQIIIPPGEKKEFQVVNGFFLQEKN